MAGLGPSPCRQGRGFRLLGCEMEGLCLAVAAAGGWPGRTCAACVLGAGEALTDVSDVFDADSWSAATLAGIGLVIRCGRCDQPFTPGELCDCHFEPHPQVDSPYPHSIPRGRADLASVVRDGRAVLPEELVCRRGCAVAECEGEHHAQGLCHRHYVEAREQARAAAGVLCAECDRPAVARGLCSMHYQRARRQARRTPPSNERSVPCRT